MKVKRIIYAVLVIGVYALLIGFLSRAFVIYHLPDRYLPLLLIPVILAALFFSRIVYLLMLLIGLGGAAWAASHIAADLIVSLSVTFATALICLIVAELIHRMIRARHQINTALLESERKYRTLVEMFPQAVLILQDLKVVYANPAAAALAGYEDVDLFLGQEAWMGLSDQDQALVQSYMETHQYDTPSRPERHEMRLKRADGEEFPAEVILKMILYRGQPAVQVVIIDITDRIKNQQDLQESEERYRLISEVTSDFAYVAKVDDQGKFLVLWGTDAISRITGYSVQDLAELGDLLQIFQSDDTHAVEKHRECILSGKSDSAEFRLFSTAKTTTWLRHSARPILNPETGDIDQVYGAVSDITDRKLNEQAQLQANHKREEILQDLKTRRREDRLLIEMGDLLQSCLTPQEVFSVVGRIAKQLFVDLSGAMFSLDESRHLFESAISWGDDLIGEAIFDSDECWALRRGRVHIFAPPENHLYCPHVFKSPAQESEPQHSEIPQLDNSHLSDLNPHLCMPLTAQGEILGLLHMQFPNSERPDSSLQLARALADRTALALANLKLRESLRLQAQFDLLTGLYNHSYLVEILGRGLRRAAISRSSLSVVSLDIDGFKLINDNYGREAGDLVLREFGQLLRGYLRREESAGRLSGDEFLFLLPDFSLEEAIKRAEFLREAASNMRLRHAGYDLGIITVSCGVAGYPWHGIKAEEVLNAIDQALSRAKEQGGDRVILAA